MNSNEKCRRCFMTPMSSGSPFTCRVYGRNVYDCFDCAFSPGVSLNGFPPRKEAHNNE